MPPRPCRAVLASLAAAACALGSTAAAARPDPRASTSTDKPTEPRASKPGASASKTTGEATRPGAVPSGAKQPDPRASKPTDKPTSMSTDKPDPKASKSTDKPTSKPGEKPDPKASKPTDKPTDKPGDKPGPKASKPTDKPTDKPGEKPDPKASRSADKPDPKASKSTDKPTSKPGDKPDPKASRPADKPVPKASKPTDKPGDKPDPKASKSTDKPTSKPGEKPDPKASQRAEPPVPEASTPPDPLSASAPPLAPAAADGYWLAARLLGPPEAVAAARRTLAADLGASVDAAGTLGARPSLAEAVQWLARWSFSGDPLPALAAAPADLPLHQGPAPIPGGALYRDHGVVLHALTITGRSGDGGTRTIRWPQTASEIVPPDLPWVTGVLLADRAPLFAAPAAHVPPAGERHALVRRSGSLFILGYTDRCTAESGARVCLHWAQVIARDGDEFHAGYLPAFQVARVDGWIRGAGQHPRVQLLVAGTAGASAQLLLVARTRDGKLHRRTLLAPMTGDAYPAARVRLDGEWATVEFTGAAAQRVAVDASLDARVR
ncbi:MAG: hypothetical protein JNL82_14305 [Myxococcales bacterium]|nr:hypothetical protein [Myxococcales bacterium]